MWTRRFSPPDDWEPAEGSWIVSYRAQPCGSVWSVRGHWCWVSWTSPHEAGQAETMAAALTEVRAAVLRTDGTISRLRSLTGPDFPAEAVRYIRR